MKKNLLLTLSVSLLSVGGLASADFKAAGTDYSKALASQEKWSEDAANAFIEMPNSFACIIANSGADANPNAEWTSLIDEVACGLAEADPKSNATVYSKASVKSSRASNNSAQELTAWFNAQGGMRFVTDVTLKQSAETLAPFGEWYFAYYQAGMQNPTNGVWTSYTKADSGNYGYVDIAPSGNDVAILVAIEGQMDGAMDGDPNNMLHDDTYAKVLFVDGSSTNTKFLGYSSDYKRKKSDNSLVGTKSEGFIAGATSSTHYFRQNLNSAGALVAGTEACFDRSVQFETTHESGLYNVSTGKRVNLAGGFGFQKADGTRGYLGSWGVWIDGGETNFTTNNRSLAVTDDDGKSYTLKWTPGKLEQKTLTDETLANGDTFKMWYDEGGEEVTAVWNSAGNKFVLNGESTTNQDLSSTNWERYMWSDVKRAEVIWSGGSAVKLQNRKEVTFSSTLADATSTKFYSKYTGGNRHTKASSLPYSLSAFNAAENTYSLMYDNATASGSKTYHLTGSAPGGSFEPNTLYLDDGNGSLSANDKPIRFDFALNEKRNKSTDYGNSDATASFTFNESKWPGDSVALVLASEADTTGDTCDKAGGDYSGCTTYDWRFGAFPWDHATGAYDSSGAAVTLDEPIMIEYTYVASDDRNNGQTIDILTKDEYNPLSGCTDIQDGGGNTEKTPGDAETKYGESCSNVSPASYAGKKFLLEYDGQGVHGMPGLEVCTDALCSGIKYWVRLLNLKDGTELTDTKGNKYAFLSSAVSSTFKPVNDTNCSAIKFTSLANLGIESSDLPSTIDRASTDYPLPSSAWTDAPTTSKCTVTMGDTSNCN